MYGGFSKASGAVIGRVARTTDGRGGEFGNDNDNDAEDECANSADIADEENLDTPDAVGTTAAEESFLAVDSSGRHVGYQSYLDLSGELAWRRADDVDTVLRRTVSMSQMTSMLRDIDRCHLYEKALSICIPRFIETEGRRPSVLDIGTGTGLLAMFAAKYGAERIVGCEMFAKMAEIAGEVVRENGFSDRISVIPDKSSSFSEPKFADIIISELLDSALLGESCVYSHADAIDRLYKGDPSDLTTLQNRIIPHSSQVYGTLIQSEDVKNFRSIDNVMMFDCTPYRNNYADNNEAGEGAKQRDVCPGGTPLIPVHWKEIERLGGCIMSETKGVMSVEFFHGSDDPYNVTPNEEGEDEANFRGMQETSFVVHSDGPVHAVLIWWELNLLSPELDPHRTCVYSTAPDSGLGWQDHWVQVVFPFADPIECVSGDTLVLKCYRNDIQMWFDISKAKAQGNQNNQDAISRSNSNNSSGSSNNSDSSHGNTSGESSTTKKPRKEELISSSRESDNSQFYEGSSSSSGGSSSFCVSSGTFEDPRSCDCGWHMLFGAENIHLMNDQRRKAIRERAICKLGLHVSTLLKEAIDSNGEKEEYNGNENGNENEIENEDNAEYDAPSASLSEVAIPRHQHTLTKGLCPYADAIYACDICGQAGRDEVFSCGLCGFDVHPSCIDSLLSPQVGPEIKRRRGLRAVGQEKLLVLDVGDSSIMSMGLSKFMKNLPLGNEDGIEGEGSKAVEDCLAVVSVEKKEFSRLFFNGLINSNDLHGILSVWDGCDDSELSYFTSKDDDEEKEEEGDNDKQGVEGESDGDAEFKESPTVHLLLSECFYFQLNNLPIWEAVSFYHRRRAYSLQLHPRAMVCPCTANIMVAVIELPDLSTCHGVVGCASGFPHSALDSAQRDWHTHVYPYRVASYRHKLLSDPIVVTAFDYVNATHVVEVEAASVVSSAGTIHGIVLWVDYQLIPGDVSSVIKNYEDGKFPFSYKTNVRFIPQAVEVAVGAKVSFQVSYSLGDSEVNVSLKS